MRANILVAMILVFVCGINYGCKKNYTMEDYRKQVTVVYDEFTHKLKVFGDDFDLGTTKASTGLVTVMGKSGKPDYFYQVVFFLSSEYGYHTAVDVDGIKYKISYVKSRCSNLGCQYFYSIYLPNNEILKMNSFNQSILRVYSKAGSEDIWFSPEYLAPVYQRSAEEVKKFE